MSGSLLECFALPALLLVASSCGESSSTGKPDGVMTSALPSGAPSSAMPAQNEPSRVVPAANTGGAPAPGEMPNPELTTPPALSEPEPVANGPAQLQLVEVTISPLEQALETRLVTPAQLTDAYLARIAAYDDAGPALNSIL